jgi:hypothetical protein
MTMVQSQPAQLPDKPKTPEANLKALLLNSKEALAAVATSLAGVGEMLGLAASRQPRLLNFEMSILNFAMTCRVGLTRTLGTIYAVPFKRNFKGEMAGVQRSARPSSAS